MAKRSTPELEPEPELEPVTRVRRTEEDRIAALEAQITALKAKAEARKAKKDPSLKHVSAALRSIDKALAASEDQATRGALGEARATISAALSLNGVSSKGGNGVLIPQRRRAVGAVEANALLALIQKGPGQRSEQLSAALGADAASIRPVMHRLIDEKKVRAKGHRRGMTRHPV